MQEKKVMTVAEAGRRGGTRTVEQVRSGELPADFYQQIGHKGGLVGGRRGGNSTKSKVQTGELPKDHFQQIGKKGGARVRELIALAKQAEKV